MQTVCIECHNQNFIETYYAEADNATESINAFIRQSDEIKAQLLAAGLLSDNPFDEQFDFIHYETWHHFGRTAKFGIWMQGADYAQWHGAYEVVKGLAELKEMANQRMEEK